MSLFLLDSCVVIDILRGRRDRVESVRRIVEIGGVLGACGVTVAEVMTGMRPSERDATMKLLDSLEYLLLPYSGALKAGEWRRQYRFVGVTLSTPDCLVAAAACEHGATLITDNISHYPQPEIRILPASEM